MKNDILTFVDECDVCQWKKWEMIKIPRNLQPFPLPSSIWTDVSMDFITSLPESSKKSVIMVVFDSFPIMLIFTLYHTHLPQHWWLKFSWTKSSHCMACRLPLCLIEIPLSPANFGRKFWSYRTRNSIWVQLIIPKPMVKPKQSTNFWRPICGASLQRSSINGYSGFL